LSITSYFNLDFGDKPKDGSKMYRQPKWVRGKHVERTATFSLPVSAEKVFPLLCPVREYEWIPDWSCKMVYSQSGFAEKGAVFTTKSNPLGKMLWTCTVFEPPKRIEYLRTLGSSLSVLLELELTTTKNGCDLTWTMKSTFGPSLIGFLLRNKMTEKIFSSMINLKKEQLLEFFSSNK
jgi:hypothetical protein